MKPGSKGQIGVRACTKSLLTFRPAKHEEGMVMKKEKKEKKDEMHFSWKRHPRKGVLSAVIAIASFLVLCALAVIACKKDGNIGLFAGVVGLLMFGIDIAGLVLGAKSYGQRGFSNQYPWIGMIGNGIMILIYAGLYLVGAVL